MAGHSKWANIKHRKAKQDAAKGKFLPKLSVSLFLLPNKGARPSKQPSPTRSDEKAYSVNMTKDTVKRAIERGAGGGDNDNMQEILRRLWFGRRCGDC